MRIVLSLEHEAIRLSFKRRREYMTSVWSVIVLSPLMLLISTVLNPFIENEIAFWINRLINGFFALIIEKRIDVS